LESRVTRVLPWWRTVSRHTSESSILKLLFLESNTTILFFRATILQHETSKMGKVNTESLAKPAIMRAGADGELKVSSF